MEFLLGSISIFLGGAVAHSAVAVRMLHGFVDGETEKAIKVSVKNAKYKTVESVWIPKKALEQYTEHSYKLAKWFRPDGYQERFFERHSDIGGVSAG